MSKLWNFSFIFFISVFLPCQRSLAESPPHWLPWEQAKEGKKWIQKAELIQAKVEKIRGWKGKSPISKAMIDTQGVRQYLLQEMLRQASDQEIEGEALTLKQLGLLPHDMAYKDFMVDLLSKQIAGFYDDREKILFLVQNQSLDHFDEIFSHEIFHAIQDQYFSLTQLQGKPFDNADRALARTALIEGDATAVMLDFALPNGKSFTDSPGMMTLIRLSLSVSMGFDDLSNAPEVIQQSLIFPYLEGLNIIYQAKRKGGWEAVNALYQNPPNSTEQVLHLDKLLEQRDEPQDIVLDHDQLFDAQILYNNVFGELGYRIYFKHFVKNQEFDPIQAAEGWDGDRLISYQDQSGKIFILAISVWDTQDDAVEAWNALHTLIPIRFPSAILKSLKKDQYVGYQVNDSWIWIERQKDLILYMENLPWPIYDQRFVQAREKIWSSLTLKPY